MRIAIIFLLLSFCSINAQAATKPVSKPSLSKPCMINKDTIIQRGKISYVLTKQGYLQVMQFSHKDGREYYQVRIHKTQGKMRYWCDACMNSFSSRFELAMHMGYVHRMFMNMKEKKSAVCKPEDILLTKKILISKQFLF